MWSFLQSLTPSFRRAKAQGELIDSINGALDDGRVDVASHGLRTLIAGYHRMPSTLPAVIAIVDRTELGIDFKEHPAPGAYTDKLSLAYEAERAAQERFDNSDFGKFMHNMFHDPRATPPTPVERMFNAVLRSVEELTRDNMRDETLVPTVRELIRRVAQSDPERALYVTEYLAKEASPHWLGFVIPEDMALTDRYKAKQPLKRAAVDELLHIADQAFARNELRVAFQAAAAAENVTPQTPEWKETHQIAAAKRDKIGQKLFSSYGF